MSNTSSHGGNAISRFFHSSLEHFDIWFYYQVWVLFAVLFLKMGWNTIPQICTASVLAFVLGYGLRWICQGSNVLANWVMRIKIFGMIVFWVFFLVWAMGDGGDWFHKFSFGGAGITPWDFTGLDPDLPQYICDKQGMVAGKFKCVTGHWDYFWINPQSPPKWLPGDPQWWIGQIQGAQQACCLVGMGYFVVKSLFFLVLNGAFYVDTFHGHARSHSAATVVDHHHAAAHATQHHMTIFAHRNGARNAACDVATFVDVHPRGVVQRPSLEPLGEWAPRELVLQDTEEDVPDFHVKTCEEGYYSVRGISSALPVPGCWDNCIIRNGDRGVDVGFAVHLILHRQVQFARNRWGKHILYRVNAALNVFTLRQIQLDPAQFENPSQDIYPDPRLETDLAQCGFEVDSMMSCFAVEVEKPKPPPKPAGGAGGRGRHP